jgi:hypothetical protein
MPLTDQSLKSEERNRDAPSAAIILEMVENSSDRMVILVSIGGFGLVTFGLGIPENGGLDLDNMNSTLLDKYDSC